MSAERMCLTITLQVDPAQLAPFLDLVAARIRPVPEHDQGALDPDRGLLTKQELARLWSVTPATIDRRVREGMPFAQVGGVRRFKREVCQAWLDAQPRRQPKPLPALRSATEQAAGVRLLSRIEAVQ